MSDLSVCWQRGVQTEGARWLLEKALSGDQKERDDGICKKNRASNVNEEKTKIKVLQKIVRRSPPAEAYLCTYLHTYRSDWIVGLATAFLPPTPIDFL